MSYEQFYSRLIGNYPHKITANKSEFLKVIDGSIYLPEPFHIKSLDDVWEAAEAFKTGYYRIGDFNIQKDIIGEPIDGIEYLKKIDSYEIFAIDIETSNLDTNKNKNKVLCIGIAYEPAKGVSFLRNCIEDEEFRNAFQQFINTHKFILHNGLFDKSRTELLTGIKLKIDEDTMLKHYVGINEHRGTHGLKRLAQLYLGFEDWEAPLEEWKKTFCRSKKIKIADFQYSYFPEKTLAEYNVIDCCATYQLNIIFDLIMRENAKNIYYKLVEASEYYSDMIVRGMMLDIQYCVDLRNKLEYENEVLLCELNALMPGVLVTSPKQLSLWLQRRFPEEAIEATDERSIEDLLERHPNDEALEKILLYRKNMKYLKTYVMSLLDKKDENNVVHCEFKLHGTETGRLSSANPNFQNVPRDKSIKSMFIAHPGYQLLQLDYSQAELRVLAHISGDEALQQCYIDGRDLHTEIQKKLFKDNYDPHNKDQRVIAKTINFGIPYGRTATGMASMLKLSRAEANQYLEDWFAAAPKVKDYIEKCHEMAMAKPQELYFTVFGRTRHYFVTKAARNHVLNQSVNFPISSTANDFTIHALVEIGKWLKENNYDAYLVNTVHDSIVIEVRPEDAEVIAKQCQYFMSEIPKKYIPDTHVPFRADAEIGYSYGDLHEL